MGAALLVTHWSRARPGEGGEAVNIEVGEDAIAEAVDLGCVTVLVAVNSGAGGAA